MANFVLYLVLKGVALSLLGVLVERLLIKNGLVRGTTFDVVFGCFFLAFCWQLVDDKGTYSLLWITASVLASISLNRSDFMTSLMKGPWWWKQENEGKPH